MRAQLEGARMTDFTPDFAGSAPGYAQVDGPLLLGLDPLILALVAALILIAGAVGWWLGHTGSAKGDEEAVAKEIHARILKAAEAALASPSNRIREKAEALRAEIAVLLEPVIDLSKGLNGRVGDLDKAIKGDAPEEKPKAPPPPPPQAAVVPVTVTVGAPAAAAPAPPPPDKEKDKPKKLSHEDQVVAISAAVRAFHDHWSQGEKRRAELARAARALTRMPAKRSDPAPAQEGATKRVWER